MSSQVVTLYEDKAKTNALYPRTKVSAISDDDGKVLSETISELNTKTLINYLRPTLLTTTLNGVTITNNGDGTYTLNGTATKDSEAILMNNMTLKKGTYRLVGCPNGGLINTYRIRYHEQFYSIQYADDFGDGNTFTIDSDMDNSKNNVVTIYIASGTTINNLVFKPMITDDLSATYDDFVNGFDCLTPDLKMDLLWTNANISSNAVSFLPQTLNLNLLPYKFLIIKVLYSTDYYNDHEYVNSNLVFINDNFDTNIVAYSRLGSGYGSRRITVTNKSINIKDGYVGGNLHNGICIPYQIYGVK